MANIQKIQKTRRRRGFLIGLLAGQILILAMDFGGVLLIHFLRNRVRFAGPLPLESLVFLGMTAGILITALLIAFVLGIQGAGYVFGKKKVGFWTAVGRGMKRVGKAAWALGLTLGVIGGTAWFLIPRAFWKPTAAYVQEQGQKAYDGTKDWIRETLKK